VYQVLKIFLQYLAIFGVRFEMGIQEHLEHIPQVVKLLLERSTGNNHIIQAHRAHCVSKCPDDEIIRRSNVAGAL
jgi:hypothetical protein